MTKALAGLLAVTLLALAAVGIIARQQAVQIGALQAEQKTLSAALSRAVEQRKQSDAALVAWRAEKASKAQESARAQQAVQEALQRVPSWSEAQVPTEVQEALGGAKEARE